MTLLHALPIRSRPREKLVARGAQILSTHELLMVILGNGILGTPVEKVARSLEHLLYSTSRSELSLEKFLCIRGIGQTKAVQLLAIFELMDRFQRRNETVFTSPGVIASYLHDLQQSKREQLICLYLNARYQLVHREVVAVGSLNQTLIHPRDVFIPIAGLPVAAIVLAHNHPSGVPEPSEDDKIFTTRIKQAAELFGIEFSDHIILAKQGYVSMKERGVL
ncbi:MAG: DNA repair protein RadC [Candidatus Pacebacteria bacterium]|nr:DNA repair protein RadC [Candidatus Paceibacterota bacterium]